MEKNNINRLRRIIEVQDITLEHTKRGVTQQWVYENIMYPRFYFSLRTYYKYLAYPAKRELRELESKQTKGAP